MRVIFETNSDLSISILKKTGKQHGGHAHLLGPQISSYSPLESFPLRTYWLQKPVAKIAVTMIEPERVTRAGDFNVGGQLLWG